ncbi:hypothetical protein [Acinetobacter nematophilus]|uniref:Lipoprotein n=1 Tax=Acinetobacter nematophilus TaxID=2994642 RepID=A0A9X3IH27_9GAMM|nr:hypothetical protein [Acinetobacter nematophilus]
MNNKFILLFIIFLSGCNQADKNLSSQNKQIETQKNTEVSKFEIEESIPAKPEPLDQALATFAFQETSDGHLANNCIWTDDPDAQGKVYWSIIPSSMLNGKSKFTAEDLTPSKVKIGQPIKNCNEGYQDERAKYAHAIDHNGDLVNTVALKLDRMTETADHLYTIDLNKNSHPEKIYVCYNMESLDVFFIDSVPKNPDLRHVNIELSYAIDGEIEPDISCGKVFYQKSGIIAKEDPKTGESTYRAQ